MTVRQVEVWFDPLSWWVHGPVRPLLGAEPLFREPLYDDKVRHLERLVVDAPDDGVAHNNLGALYYQAGRMDDALRHLVLADRLRPDDPWVLTAVLPNCARTMS